MESIQNEIAKIKDYGFFNRAMFLFENNKYVNSAFINEINDKEYSDFSSCTNIRFDTENACIVLDDIELNGTYSSTAIKTFNDKATEINNFFLVVEEELPPGTDILYYLITSEEDRFSIVPNRNTPLMLSGKLPETITLKAELKSNGITTPKITALAIYYFDSEVDKELGLTEPNLSISKGEF